MMQTNASSKPKAGPRILALPQSDRRSSRGQDGKRLARHEFMARIFLNKPFIRASGGLASVSVLGRVVRPFFSPTDSIAAALGKDKR